MVEKRLRMSLDFEVSISEVTEESMRDYYRPFRNFEAMVSDPDFWANLSRQIRLHRALLEDDESLFRFLTYAVVNEVDSSLDSRLGEVFSVNGRRIEEEILESLFSRLEEEDARYFRDMSASGTLWENVEVLNQSFVVRWRAAALDEVRSVAEGSFDSET